jgi:NAD(P)-dependent dehydrogenase (short-subunit alcohol dehydrogenase family)
MENKVAIITGSTAGIGFAIAKTLAKAGISVVINGRTLEKLKQAEAEIEAFGGSVLSIQADACDAAEIRRIVKETKEYFGKIDILVNNAATVGVGYSVEKMPIEVWDEVLNANLRAVFLFCQAVIPFLKEQSAGRIVNIGGLSSKNPLPFAAADACAKAGISALTRVLAAELGASNITVNTVIPGFQPETEVGKIFNERLAEAFHITPEQSIEGTKARTLLKRFETLDEIAEMVLFLCSEAGAGLTGQNLNVNCGLATY